MIHRYPCPRCAQPSQWQDNPFRPFCSERCKMIDLGAWASDEYRIATPEAPSANQKKDLDDYED